MRMWLVVVFAVACAGSAGADHPDRDFGWTKATPGASKVAADPVGGLWSPMPRRVDQPLSIMASLVTGAIFLGLAGYCVWRLRGWLRQVRSEARIDPVAPLRRGPFVLVGIVEPGEGAGSPVTVRVRQQGTEIESEGRWTHRWAELERTTEARPFTVRRDDGARVKVEPGLRVVVHDSLTRVEASDRTDERVRIAEVEAGARVYISGLLGDVVPRSDDGIYRTTTVMPTLVGTRLAPVVISTEVPGDTAKRQLRVHILVSLLVFAVLAFAIATSYGPYLLRATLGRVQGGTIEEVHHYETWEEQDDGGDWSPHWEARVTWTTGPGDLESDVFPITEELYDCVAGGRCDRVTVLDAHWGPWRSWQVGSTPMLLLWQVFLELIAAAGALIAVAVILRLSRPWYLRRRLVERGIGRLALAPARSAATPGA